MDWDYAQLSKAAKKAGGPENLMNMLIESGKDAGHKEMLPLVGIAAGIGALGYAGISRLVKFFKKKTRISPEAVEEAKAELIKGIEDYDAKCSEENEGVDSEEGGEINE